MLGNGSKLPERGLRNLRISKKLTQKQLAEKIFVTHQSISNWENGAPISEHHLPKLARAFGLSVDKLRATINVRGKELESEVNIAPLLGAVMQAKPDIVTIDDLRYLLHVQRGLQQPLDTATVKTLLLKRRPAPSP